jgi:hypothetical protein
MDMSAREPFDGPIHRRELPQSWDGDDWLLGLDQRARLDVIRTSEGTRVHWSDGVWGDDE